MVDKTAGPDRVLAGAGTTSSRVMDIVDRLSGDQVDAYLARIGYAGGREPTRQNLLALVRAHRLAVPFETLDCWRGRRTSIDMQSLFEKIVVRRRGGYCFELNGLFAALLRGLGYRVAENCGRWLLGEENPFPMRRHRVLRVAPATGPVQLVDVGIGVPFMMTPLDFVLDVPQMRGDRIYRIERDPRLVYVITLKAKDTWTRICGFDTAPYVTADFACVHWWCQTHPDSTFLKNVWVFLPFADGTMRTFSMEKNPETGLDEPVLAVFDGKGGLTKRILRDEREIADALKENFGLVEA